MSDMKDVFRKVFNSSRSNSTPAQSSAEVEEVINALPDAARKTLRRSRSGRVKALVRPRSMVSTFDFRGCDQEIVREVDTEQKQEVIEGENIGRRIKRNYPATYETEQKVPPGKWEEVMS